MNNKITFPDLVQLVADATSTTPLVSELFLKELFATISQALIKGQNVTIKHLGTFALTAVPNRSDSDNRGYNRLTFTPDKALAEVINQPFSAFKPITLSDDVTDRMLQELDGETMQDNTDDEPQTPAPPAEQPDQRQPEPETPAIINHQPADDEPLPQPVEMPDKTTVALPPPFVTATVPVTPQPEPAADPEPLLAVADEGSSDHHQPLTDDTAHEGKGWRQGFMQGLLAGCLAALAVCALIWALTRLGSTGGSVTTSGDTLTAATTAVTAQPVDTATSQVANKAATAAPVSTVTDTCTASMYLSKMSVKHYGKPDFWIYIYEENRDKIDDPNNVPPGTVVSIPAAAKYGIDPNDKSSIDRARRRTYEVATGH